MLASSKRATLFENKVKKTGCSFLCGNCCSNPPPASSEQQIRADGAAACPPPKTNPTLLLLLLLQPSHPASRPKNSTGLLFFTCFETAQNEKLHSIWCFGCSARPFLKKKKQHKRNKTQCAPSPLVYVPIHLSSFLPYLFCFAALSTQTAVSQK